MDLKMKYTAKQKSHNVLEVYKEEPLKTKTASDYGIFS